MRELQPLNDVKSKFKQLSTSVIQDLYNVFFDVSLVDEILTMTFPMFRDQNNHSRLAEMFNKPKEIEALRGSRPMSLQGDTFWTDTLVRSFLRMQGG